MMKIKKGDSVLIKMLLVILIGLLFIGCTQPPADDDDDDDDNPTTTELPLDKVLTNLGINQDLAPPEDDNGVTISGTRNPLGPATATLLKSNELYMVGAAVADRGSEMILDGVHSTLTNLHTKDYSSADDWMYLPKKSVSADIDDDGYDEIITAVFIAATNRLQFQILDNDGTAKTPINLDNQTCLDVLKSPEMAYDYFFKRDFTTGDFDGDGKPDFAVACDNTVIILDHTLSEVTRFELPFLNNTDGGDIAMVRVEAGDLNGDNIADLVVVNGTRWKYQGFYYIFEGTTVSTLSSSNLTTKAVYSGALGSTERTYSSAEVAIGDIDGNGLNDIILAGLEKRSDEIVNCFITSIDPYNEAGKAFATQYHAADYQFATSVSFSSGVYPFNYAVPRTVPGDFDGNGSDEILVLDQTYSFDGETMTRFTDGVFNTTNDTANHNYMFYDLAVAGDMNGDGSDELALMIVAELPWKWGSTTDGDNSLVNRLKIWGKNSSGSLIELQDIEIAGDKRYPTLTLANVDNDSLVLKYIKREIQFSEPEILAVLASAPYRNGMDIGGSSTMFEITSGEETSEGWKNGFNTSVTVGLSLEFEVGLGIGGGRSLVVENNFAWGFGASKSTSLNYGYTGAAGTDMVLFTAVPIDVYVYEILSAPNSDAIGEPLTINVPREAQEKFLEVATYNSLVNPDQRIPDDVLKHTIGNPESYYTKTEMEALYATEEGFYYTGEAKPIGQGAGATVSISYSEDNAGFDYYEYDLMAGYEEEAKLLVVDLGFSVGYSYGYSIEHTVSNGFTIEGVIGSYKSMDDMIGNEFDWGLMMIPIHIDEQDQHFNLVTYWVD